MCVHVRSSFHAYETMRMNGSGSGSGSGSWYLRGGALECRNKRIYQGDLSKCPYWSDRNRILLREARGDSLKDCNVEREEESESHWQNAIQI